MRFSMFAVPALVTGAAMAMLASAQIAAAQVPGADTQAYGPPQSYAGSSGGSIDELHTALRLNAQQEAAWKNYRAATTLTQQGQARRQAASRLFPSLDAPRRMDLVEAEMRQELADIHSQSAALKAFYGTLTVAQRKIFDQRTLPAQNGAGQGQYRQ